MKIYFHFCSLLTESTIGEHETDEPITEKIKIDFEKQKLITIIDKKNTNDTVLAHLAFVFDLNYQYSFQSLYDHKIIKKYFNQIKNKEKFKPYFEMVQNYIEERVDKNVRQKI